MEPNRPPSDPPRHAQRLGALELLAAALLSLLVYFLLRIPSSGLSLPFYDDGELLYHTLSVLQGRVPHRDDFNHHFSGYVLPIVLAAKAFGFSTDLLKEVALLNQALLGAAVYALARSFHGRSVSGLCALLAVSAREPWVIGLMVQHQLNPLIVFMLIFALRGASRGQVLPLRLSFLIYGVLAVFDQRAIFLGVTPLAALWLARSGLGAAQVVSCLLTAALPPLAALTYLAANDGLSAFVEQTLVFPARFRVGSRGTLDLIGDALTLHWYLISESPILLCLGLAGLPAVCRAALCRDRRCTLLLVQALPLGVMASLGSRDFSYYTITWLPYLAILASFARIRPERLRLALLAAPTALAMLSAAIMARDEALASYRGDGAEEVVRILSERLRPDDKLFVWGYRLDLNARLGRLSPYPFGSTIFFHPDHQIADPEARAKHIFPKYEALFFELLERRPPRIVVLFNRGDRPPVQSSARDRLLEKVAPEAGLYRLMDTVERRDLAGELCRFEIYELLEGRLQERSGNAKLSNSNR